MSESAQALDRLTQQLAEFQRTVGGRLGDATIDNLKSNQEFQRIVNELAEARFNALQDANPVRRVPGEDVYTEATLRGVAKSNRYYNIARDFAAKGYSRELGKNVKPVDLWIAHRMMETQMAKKSLGIHGVQDVRAPSQDLSDMIKALTSTGSATGDELVPTNLASQLWDDIFLASRVVNAMTVVPMPTNPFDVPLGLGSVTWRKGTENAATSTSDPSTAKSTLTATELLTEQNWSYTLEEDAMIALAPALRARLAQSGGEIIDDFALNADATSAATGNINSDDAAPAADSYYLSDGQDGIRHQWLVDNTAMGNSAGGDALVDSDIVGILAEMGKYAVDPNKTIIVCDTSTYLKGFLATGTGAPGEYVATLDKFGPDAIIRTGQLASYRGIPIIVSASHPKGEADGKVSVTAASNTLGSFSVVNTMMWYAGFRRQLLIETDVDIRKRQYIMVTSLREAVAAHGTRSTNTHTGGVYNILV